MSHESSNKGAGLRQTRIAPFLVAMTGALLALMFIGAVSAKADPVQMKFATGTINLGGEDGTWAKLIDPDLAPPDPPALISADYGADGNFTAPKENFFFPPKKIEDLATGNGALPVVDAKIDIKSDADFSGNFNPATGVANVSVPVFVLIDVYSAGSPVSSAKCSVSGFNLELSTTGNMSDPGGAADPGPPPTPARPPAEYDAAPFTGFPGGDGALIAKWAGLPSSEVVSGGLASIVCPALDGMLGGPGGVFMDGFATDRPDAAPTAPELQPKITSAPAATTSETTAKFAFTRGDGEPQGVDGFDCKLDAADWAACDEGTKTYAGQQPGSHTFHVRATNGLGVGPEKTQTWTIQGAIVCPEGQTGTPPNCETPPGKAKLGGLKIKLKYKAVKRGKKATFTAKVKNVGDATAKGVKICVKAPKKLVKVKQCARIGNLAAGKTGTAKFKVKVSKKAKKGKKATLKFKATSANAGAKSAKAKVKIK